MELFWKYELGSENFAKRIKWSPDGSELIANMESGHLLTFKSLDQELEYRSKLKGHMGGFNDFEWYPWMSSSLSGSDLFITSSKDLPIQLWSSSEGKVLCSYTAKDHLYQVANCLSVSFSPDGQKIISGGESKLWIFDTNRPGDRSLLEFPTIKNKKARGGQRGIISCLNFRFDTSGVLATGSFKGSIGIYDLRSMEQKGPACCIFDAHRNGVSQIKFLDDGWSMISAGRRDTSLKKWDLRMLQDVRSSNDPIIEFKSDEFKNSNQRIFFDTFSTKLYTGIRHNLSEFDLRTGEIIEDSINMENIVSSVSARKDGVLAISTGTRNFDIVLEYDSENFDNENNIPKSNSIAIIVNKI